MPSSPFLRAVLRDVLLRAAALAELGPGFDRGLALRDQYRDHDRIEVGFGPHSTYMLSEQSLSKVAMLAEELDAPVQIHLHETRDEVLNSVERVGARPVDFLEQRGLLGPRTQCVHMTALGEQDMDTLTTFGAHVVHCPRSNLKLGSGVCPVQRLLEREINVALGTDGAASNNRLNMLGELQLASLIGKTEHGDSKAVDAWTALEMATINGARALGQDAMLGTVEVGKAADLIALDLSGVHHMPRHDLASSLVYASDGTEVTWSWVAGQAVVRNRQLQTLDPSDLTNQAAGMRGLVQGADDAQDADGTQQAPQEPATSAGQPSASTASLAEAVFDDADDGDLDSAVEVQDATRSSRAALTVESVIDDDGDLVTLSVV